ncbi:MAG TPA: hypothetical protein VI358_17970 [Pseudolabrys sp.]
MADRTIRDLITEDTAPKAPAAPSLDLGRIKGNVAKMVNQGAPESDIDAYISGEGTTPEAIKAYQPKPESWGEYGYGLLQKAGQGATLGYGDEIAAGAGAVGNKIMRGVGLDIPERNYGDILGEIRGEQKTFEGRHPYQGMAAEVTGGAAPAIAAAPEAAATWLGRVGMSALYGGGYGAASGFGNSEGGVGNRLVGGIEGGLTGAVAGPVLSDVVLPAAARIASVVPQSVRYAERALQSARDPEGTAFKNIADKGVSSGLDFDKMLDRISPGSSAQLKRQGFSDNDIATIISRQLNGEDAARVVADYAHLKNAKGQSLTAATARKYLKAYQDANPTPLNVLDLARETAGEGGAGPMSRYGRAVQTIGGAEDSTAAQALLSRQELQPGRVAGIWEKRSGAGDFEAQKAANAKQLQQESRKAYGKFYQEPDLATNELSDLLEEPLFQSAVKNAQRQERLSIINDNQQIAKQNVALRQLGKPTLPLRGVPSVDVEAQVYSPQLMDLIQRDLRLSGEAFSNPNEANYARNLRDVFLDRIEKFYPSFKGIRETYASGKLEQDAFDYGMGMSSNLGTNTRQALARFDDMTPAQQAIIRSSFGSAERNKVLGTKEGAQAANRYTSEAFKEIIKKLYPKSDKALYDEGKKLVQELRTEANTTRTKNFQLSGSITAEKLHDQELAQTAAEAASHAVTGNYLGVLKTLGKRLSQQIGTEGSKQSLKILTETQPDKLIPILQRLAREAKTSGERQAYVASIRQMRANAFTRANAPIGMEAGKREAVTP